MVTKLTNEVRMLFLMLILTFISNEAKSEASLVNVAVHKPATQSSQYLDMAAGRAVDGDRSNLPESGSCSHTENMQANWLRVDLQARYNVHAVKVTNREGHNALRLKNFAVYVNDHAFPTAPEVGRLCHYVKYLEPGATKQFNCAPNEEGENGIPGRSATVVLYNNYLTLCEFQVMADPDPLPDSGSEPECSSVAEDAQGLRNKVVELKTSISNFNGYTTRRNRLMNETVANAKDANYTESKQDFERNQNLIEERITTLVGKMATLHGVHQKREGFFFRGVDNSTPRFNTTIKVTKWGRYNWGRVYNQYTGVFTATTPGLHLVMVRLVMRLDNNSAPQAGGSDYRKIGFRLMRGPSGASLYSSASVCRTGYRDADQLTVTSVLPLARGEQLWLQAAHARTVVTEADFSVVLLTEMQPFG